MRALRKKLRFESENESSEGKIESVFSFDSYRGWD